MEKELKKIITEVVEKRKGKFEDKGDFIQCEIPDIASKTPVYLDIRDSGGQIGVTNDDSATDTPASVSKNEQFKNQDGWGRPQGVGDTQRIKYSIPSYLQFSAYSKVYIESAKKTAEMVAREINELMAMGSEGSVFMDVNEEALQKHGYKLLKSKKEKLYQRPIGGKYSGFYRAQYVGGRVKLSLTAGDYDDPKKILEEERERLAGE